MRFDEESVEELTRALYQVFNIADHFSDDADHQTYICANHLNVDQLARNLYQIVNKSQ